MRFVCKNFITNWLRVSYSVLKSRPTFNVFTDSHIVERPLSPLRDYLLTSGSTSTQTIQCLCSYIYQTLVFSIKKVRVFSGLIPRSLEKYPWSINNQQKTSKLISKPINIKVEQLLNNNTNTIDISFCRILPGMPDLRCHIFFSTKVLCVRLGGRLM